MKKIFQTSKAIAIKTAASIKGAAAGEDGNEALGFIIVALITVIVGSTLLTVFNTGAGELFSGMLQKIKTTFSV